MLPRSLRYLALVAAALPLLGGGDANAQDWGTPAEESAGEPKAASAVPPEPSSHGPGVDVELGGVAAYASPPIRGGANPFGAGFGGRVGLVYSGFYLGVSVLDYLGGSDVDVSYRAIFYGLELGYGVRIPVFSGATLTLRPLLGIGVASVYYTDPALSADVVTSASGGASSSDTLTVNDLYLEPALMVMLSSGAHFAAVRGSSLFIPGIQYGGADATTWLSYSTRLELGFVF